MKVDQVVVIVYLFLGIALGIFSYYLNKSLDSLPIAFLAPVAIYAVTILPLIKTVKQKKRNWLLKNSGITFFLIWIIVWIIAYNIW